jgi:hypothetical protein
MQRADSHQGHGDELPGFRCEASGAGSGSDCNQGCWEGCCPACLPQNLQVQGVPSPLACEPGLQVRLVESPSMVAAYRSYYHEGRVHGACGSPLRVLRRDQGRLTSGHRPFEQQRQICSLQRRPLLCCVQFYEAQAPPLRVPCESAADIVTCHVIIIPHETRHTMLIEEKPRYIVRWPREREPGRASASIYAYIHSRKYETEAGKWHWAKLGTFLL